MIKLQPDQYMDFVDICRANPGKSTAESLTLWREWLADTYGVRCYEIEGRLYASGAMKVKPFRGSILYKGETTAERRAIMNGEQVYDEYGLEIVEAAQKQLDEIKNRGRK